MSLNTSAWSRRRERAHHRLFFLSSPHLCLSVCFSESRCDMTADVSIKEEKRTSIALSAALLCPLSTPQVSYIGSSLLLSGWTHTPRYVHTHAPGGFPPTTFSLCIRWRHTQQVDTQRITELFTEASARTFNSAWWCKWGDLDAFSQKQREVRQIAYPNSAPFHLQMSFLFTYQWREV